MMISRNSKIIFRILQVSFQIKEFVIITISGGIKY